MRWTISMKQIGVAILLLLTLSSWTARAVADSESRRIDYLIATVENLAGAKFVRNGTEHNGKEAAAHLRLKYKNAGGKVRTAEDFIELCASRSYLSGKPYLIVFSGEKTVSSETFFREKLKQYDQSFSGSPVRQR